MKQKCILVTSNSIEGAKIIEYLGLVSANVVLGVNAIDDFFASFTDFFGGHSGAYQKQMSNLFCEAEDKLSSNAVSMKADAVVAVKIDFDEISGKNKQMFMVTMTGTAVKLSYNIASEISDTEKDISNAELEDQLLRERVQSALSKEVYVGLKEQEWKFLVAHDGDIFCQALADKAIARMRMEPNMTLTEEIVRNYRVIYENLSLKEQLNLFYHCYEINPELALDLHRGTPVFSAKSALSFIPSAGCQEEEMDSFMRMINLPAQNYSEEDLICMEQILSALRSRPEVWRTEEKSKLLGGKVLKTVCLCGMDFDFGLEECPYCHRDKQGFSESQRDNLDKFEKKVFALKTLFSRKK